MLWESFLADIVVFQII